MVGIQKRLDYVTSFPQVPVKKELYMKTPKEEKLHGNISCDHVLSQHRNKYDQESTAKICNHYLFKQSEENRFQTIQN